MPQKAVFSTDVSRALFPVVPQPMGGRKQRQTFSRTLNFTPTPTSTEGEITHPKKISDIVSGSRVHVWVDTGVPVAPGVLTTALI